MNTPFRHIRAFSLPYGATVTFNWGAEGFDRVVDPKPPPDLSPRQRQQFLDAYLAARRDFLNDLSAMLGGPVVILDEMGVHTSHPGARQ
ncbi:MAG: hypothetical protein E5V62_03220 [Mesorhizobium sp.]|uniref:hypothetical protein n=1 Tax=Mesorhizobium sp. TaxID=1871066 RepID=UPI000FD1D9EC|nr:hypothetical protein [Mesorhizobium sp.]RVD69859.1 hypothetical protein EN751_23780 [Mesorhizobium sp. M4A.F.Ca.ET.029.04.2.1]TIW37174.1 MAG: hypothetical protein E5V62_03220 [Mesorhizobium sp.]